MGNNTAFSQFEQVVLAVHDAGALTRDLLEELAAPFRHCDADSGGYEGGLANDGLDLIEIVASLSGEELPPKPQVSENHEEHTEDEQAAWDEWNDAMWEIFNRVTQL